MLRRSRRKHSLAGLAAGIALLAYVCFLLVTNYLSAIDLQNSQLERFRQETTRRSSELGYHFEERRGELRAIARSREIAVYFENRALELSMEYGLKYSLVAINELFRSHLENRQNNQHPFYTAMALVDSGGSLITGQAQPGHKLPPAQSWKPYIGRAFVHGAIVISPVGDATVVSIAYLFRGKYAGQILAQLNQNFFHDIMQIHAPAGNRFSLLFARPAAPGPDAVFIASSLPDRSFRPRLPGREPGKHFRFTAAGADKIDQPMIGLSLLMSGTPFELVEAVPEVYILGKLTPVQHLIRMSVIALVILGAAVAMIRITMKSIVLSTRLQESMAREEEIVVQVEQRTTELARANQQLQEQAAALERANADVKTAQLQAYQQEKMASIGQLAAGVAHEINNPMGFIISNLGTLERYVARMKEFMEHQSAALSHIPDQRESLDAKRKQLKLARILSDIDPLLRETNEGAGRIKEIVWNLRNFSRIDEADFKMADINAGLESTLAIVWNEIKYKADVRKDYGTLPKTYCNLGQLNQVFMNLLVNAAQAIDQHGEIGIKTWFDGGFISISIADTGCGIAPDKLNRIFEPFYSTKDVGKGTGLGLSIAYDIVKKHNGILSVQSEPGKGTTFTVRIPVATESAYNVSR